MLRIHEFIELIAPSLCTHHIVRTVLIMLAVLIFLSVLIMLILLINLAMFIRFIFSSLRSFFEIALIVFIAWTVLIMLFVKDEHYLYACIY